MSRPLSRKKAIEYILTCYNSKDVDIREVSFPYEYKRKTLILVCSFHKKRGIVKLRLHRHLLEECKPIASSIESKLRILGKAVEEWNELCRKNLE